MDAPSPPARTTAGCPFERTHGRPCPVCRSVADGSTVLQHTPAMDTGHPDHLTLAQHVDAAQARHLYAERGFHLFDAEVRDLTREDRQALDAWAATSDPLPASFAARAHLTVSNGPFASCRRCTMALAAPATIYAPGTYVGLDCEGRARKVEA